jgi:hypothetical protein
MSDSDLTAAYLRELLEKSDSEIPLEAVELRENELRLLLDLVEAAEHLGVDVEEFDEYNRIRDRGRSLATNEAVQNDDITRLASIKGVSSSTEPIDSSAWSAADILENELWKPKERDQMLNLIVYGPTPSIRGGSNTGAGKSDFGYTGIEGGIRAYEKVGKSLKVGTNNESDPFDTLPSWSELLEWLEKYKHLPKVFMLDEAAQGLKHADQGAGDVLGKMIRLFRKYNCHLILIAHTGKDIAFDVRRQVVFARKEDKKTVVLGNKLEEDDAGEMRIKNEEYTLENLPPTSIEYDSIGDEGSFEWDIDDSDDDESEYDSCRGTKKNGDDCGQSYGLCEHGYCGIHSEQCEECRDEE